ncbi:YybH family protein [Rubrivirga litoralis]|uniref:Nuclear transport factor 2 family protein n=1 Tax=Rubrivirga litoralis TaxID=3075598 RepID=A0ABU3BLY6_9BACT|nr:nuclear transport factor 2 family protein [Rubrivirga sp. F394]MDT0630286.1 nuclear transport factor 2 family protein [Rubrivirga sp. F394]
MSRFRLALLCAALGATGCGGLGGAATPPAVTAPPAAADTAAVGAGVRAALAAQVEAWNQGSVRGFMEGYAQTDTLTFLSGGAVRRGWDEALAGYQRGYPDAEAMGQLVFSDLTVHALAADRALAWGRWRLQRAGDAPGAGPGGLFTLVLAQTPDGWRVVHDHTSSE